MVLTPHPQTPQVRYLFEVLNFDWPLSYFIQYCSLGGHVLYTLYKRSNHRKVEQLLILNLSLVEFLTNLLEIVRIVPDILRTDHLDVLVDELINILLIFTFTGLYIVMYATMVFITLDRLLNIKLNIR